MNDQFQLREDAAVAWLAFKRELGSLLRDQDEELLRIAFSKGFGDGWAKGADVALNQTKKIIEKIA